MDREELLLGIVLNNGLGYLDKIFYDKPLFLWNFRVDRNLFLYFLD